MKRSEVAQALLDNRIPNLKGNDALIFFGYEENIYSVIAAVQEYLYFVIAGDEQEADLSDAEKQALDSLRQCATVHSIVPFYQTCLRLMADEKM